MGLRLCPQGIGTDEKCLIEILASRTNQEIHDLVAAYKDGEGWGRAGAARRFLRPGKRAELRGSRSPGLDLSLFHQPTRETWRLILLETHLDTSRRCSLFCCRYLCLSGVCRQLVPEPGSAEPVSVLQGSREEDDVVSEDLVEQDAKVMLGWSLRWVASGQRCGWWHWHHTDLVLQSVGGC